MATTDQQNALKDAMARAKQIAAKLQQQQGGTGETSDMEETRKRSANDGDHPIGEPITKRNLLDIVDHTDPKIIAQQVANSLVQRASIGPMLVEEITIPNKLVGLVIGRGGEMINKLQSESGAKVQVAPDPPPNAADMINDRQITITGTAEAVNKAKALIGEIQSSGKVPERLMAGTLPGEFSIEMNIAKGKVGLVIGKGGETIKSLQERAGCKMILFQTGEYANAPEKPLRISGEQSTVMYGKQLVLDLLTSKELEGMNPEKQHQEGQGYKEIEVPREAVGLVIGAKGANIHQIQMETGCRVRFKNDMEGATKTAMLNGSPQQLAAAEAKLNEIISSNWGPRGPRPLWEANQPQGGAPVSLFNNSQGPRPGWGVPGQELQGGPRGRAPGQRPPFGSNTNLQPGHKDMVIHVPAHKCGLVIGKGGETIKFIHHETDVNIELNRDVPDALNYRVFRVQGTDEMIEKALAIIREKANDQTIVAKDVERSEAGPGQNNWGASWPTQPQQNEQWNHQQQQQQQQQWPGQQQQSQHQQQPQQQQQQQQQQAPWGQEPTSQHGPWNQQQQLGAPGWNQPQPTPQQTWDPQQQQWQHNPAPQGQWSNQQQWAQPGQTYQAQGANHAQQNPHAAAQQGQPASNAGVPAGPNQAGQAAGQPDYSAAWALYYQQQQQYYQQYAMQQPGNVSFAQTSSTSASANTQTATTPTSAGNSQAHAMAEYQAKLAEYYKSLGQQPSQ